MEQWPCFSVFCIFVRFLNVDQQRKTRNVSEGSQKLSITRGIALSVACGKKWIYRCIAAVQVMTGTFGIALSLLLKACLEFHPRCRCLLLKRIYQSAFMYYRAAIDYTIIDRFRSAVAWCECCIRNILSHSK